MAGTIIIYLLIESVCQLFDPILSAFPEQNQIICFFIQYYVFIAAEIPPEISSMISPGSASDIPQQFL